MSGDQGLLLVAIVDCLTPRQLVLFAQVARQPPEVAWEPLTRHEQQAAYGLCQAGLLEQEGATAYQLTPLGRRLVRLLHRWLLGTGGAYGSAHTMSDMERRSRTSSGGGQGAG